jgi:hypothetical protein
MPGERGIELKQESLAKGTLQLSDVTWDVLIKLHGISSVPLPELY